MKKTLLLITVLTSAICTLAQPIELYGTYWDKNRKKEFFCKADPTVGVILDIAALPGVNGLGQGLSYFDRASGIYLASTNLGILLINIRTGAVLDTVVVPMPYLKSPVYDPYTNSVYGTYWNGSAEQFARINAATGVFDSLFALPAAPQMPQGESSFNPDSGYYLIRTSTDIILTKLDGSNMRTFTPTKPILASAYDPVTNRIFGIYWNGTQEVMGSMDLDSGHVDSLFVLQGVTSLAQGESYFDPVLGYYAITTNLGSTLVDVRNKTIAGVVNAPPKYIKGVVCATRPCPLPASPVFTFSQSGFTVTISGTFQQGVTAYWNFGDGSTDTTTSTTFTLTHTYAQADTYYVCVNTSDSCHQPASYCDSMVVLATGISTIADANIHIYPNPTHGELHITHLPAGNGSYHVRIFDIRGAEVIHTSVTGQEAKLAIDHTVKPGIYLLKLEDNNHNTVHRSKLVIQ